MRLDDLIADPAVDIAAVAQHLNALDGSQRWAQLRTLDRAQQRELYRKAGPRPIELAHLVPDQVARVEVIHDGVNTLPVAGPLRRFQKRFCRPDVDGGSVLFGYNEGPLRRLIGPGYFVAVPAGEAVSAGSDWAARGGVVVDYFQVPEAPVVDGWPTVIHNGRGLQRFVYHQTRDFLRSVSDHVSVGAAFKNDHPLDHYFVLCRRD